MRYTLRTFGEPGVEREGASVDIPLGKPLAVLVRLALEPAGLPREELARLLWPGVDRSRARASVRQALTALRSLLSPDLFVGEDPVRVDPSRLDTDVGALRRALEAGRVEEALVVWRGPFLEQFAVGGAPAFERWAERTRLELNRVLGEAVEAESARLLSAGEARRAANLGAMAVEIRQQAASAHVSRLNALLALRELAAAEEAVRLAEAHVGAGAESLVEIRAHLEALEQGVARERAGTGRLEFTGRARELALLIGRWRNATEGRRQLAAVSGPAGIGKTRLMDELVLLVRSRGGAVVRARVSEPEESLDLATVAELVDQLLELPGAAGTSAFSDRVLWSLLPSRKGAEAAVAPEPRGIAVSDALTDLLGAVSFESPLLVVVDDAQWMDPASIALLIRILRRIRREPIYFVFSYRPPAPDSDAGVLERKEVRELDALVIRLEPWTEVEIAEALLESRLVEDPEDATRAAAALHPVTGGVPLALETALERCRDAGLLVETEGGERLDVDGLEAAGRQRLARSADSDRDRSGGDADSVGTRLWGWPGVAAAALVVVLVITTFALSPLGVSQPPYGGGRILIQDRDGWVAVEPEGDPSGWAAVPVPDTLPTGPVVGPFRTTAGGVLWFRNRTYPDRGPDLLRIAPPDDTALIVTSPGDVYIGSPSPDGRRLVYVHEYADSPYYKQEVVIARSDGTEARAVYRGAGVLGRAFWSPDGQLVGVHSLGRQDTLNVLALDGTEIAEWVEPTFIEWRWCGDAMVAIVARGDEHRLALRSPQDSVARVYPGVAIPPLACSPDASAVVHGGVRQGRRVLFVRELETGRRRSVGGIDVVGAGLMWVPDRLPPIPVALELPGDTLVLDWGERRALEAVVIESDGSRRPAEAVRWASDDPAIASTVGVEQVIANRPGTTRLHARWGESLVAERVVRVVGERPRRAAVADPFAAMDTTRWLPVGWPHPVVDTVDGRPALRLRGDAKYNDGVVLLRPVPIERGLTVELEARLPLTRVDYQDLELCVVGAPPGDVERETGHFRRPPVQRACLVYPVRNGSRFNPSSVGLNVSENPLLEAFLDSVPGDRWFHVALEVRPDGGVSAYLDREKVLEAPVHLRLEEVPLWTVMIAARTVGTTAHVRNLAAWTEPRYGRDP